MKLSLLFLVVLAVSFETIQAGIFRDIFDTYRAVRTVQKTDRANNKAAVAGAKSYFKSIEPEIKKTALDKKCQTAEFNECTSCVQDIYLTIVALFALTFDKLEEDSGILRRIGSGQEAVDKFGEEWEEFVQCWGEKAPQPANQEEFDELKGALTSKLASSIDVVIQDQKASREKADRKVEKLGDKMEKRHEKEEKKQADKKAKQEAKEAKKAAKK